MARRYSTLCLLALLPALLSALLTARPPRVGRGVGNSYGSASRRHATTTTTTTMLMAPARPLTLTAAARSTHLTRRTGSSRRQATTMSTTAAPPAVMVVPSSDSHVSTAGSVGRYVELQVQTLPGIYFVDLTPEIRRLVAETGVEVGTVSVLSRHTTTAITINEMEARLVDDARQFLLKLVPAAYPYLHNDLHLRHGPPGWPGGDEAWRAQEPVNCHSHLIAMLLGASEAVPIGNGELKLGRWQSIIMVRLLSSATCLLTLSLIHITPTFIARRWSCIVTGGTGRPADTDCGGQHHRHGEEVTQEVEEN